MEKDNMQERGNEVDTKTPDPPSHGDTRLEGYSQFTIAQKRAIVAMGSLASFFSPLSSSIYLPALATIADSLRISISQVNLTVTTYLVSEQKQHCQRSTQLTKFLISRLCRGWHPC
jgi:hypothetical protein